MKFVVYDKATGRIEATGFADLVADANVQADETRSVLLDTTADDLTQYVKNREIKDRPLLSIEEAYVVQADGVDKVRIYLPVGTRVTFLGQTNMLTDNKIEFVTDQPGNYEIDVEPPFPTMPKKVTISAL